MANASKRATGFNEIDYFQAPIASGYSLLPLRFIPLDSSRYVLTNFAGEYCVLTNSVTHDVLRGTLAMHTTEYNLLKTKHFLFDDESKVAIDLLAAKYRTKQQYLAEFTRLHIFVLTLRCNNRCGYCQVSRQGPHSAGYDMTFDTADKAIEFTFRSPAKYLKIEFQGGEPLLHLPLLRHIVEKSIARAAQDSRTVEFVICTNLNLIDDETLDFCRDHDICVSTSLDGPRELHNINRPNPDCDSYDATVSGIQRTIRALGKDRLSALMTTTNASLSQPRAIVDEYLRMGFHSMFFRIINPYGLAARNRAATSYSVQEWLHFYKEALAYILELNRAGIYFREEYAALLLKKILTPYSTGFVDLQSPAGIGDGVIVFNYDGDVYASDESRMLAEMGDYHFRLGNLQTNSYEQVLYSDRLVEMLRDTMSEGVPGCCDCGLQPFCGSDPVRHYRTQGDIVGFKPTSEFCIKNMGIIKHLVHLLEDDLDASDVLRSWI